MEVQRIENFKIPNAVAHEITQEELQRDFDYYRAQKVLETHVYVRHDFCG